MGRRAAEEERGSGPEAEIVANGGGAAGELVAAYLDQHPELISGLEKGLKPDEVRKELQRHMELLGDHFGQPAPA